MLNLGTSTTIDSCVTTWGIPPPPTPAGAGLAHLRGQWCGATYTKDPTARVTFGIYKGADEIIYFRENFECFSRLRNTPWAPLKKCAPRD